MNRTTLAFAILLVVAPIAGAGGSGFLDDLSNEMTDRRAALEGEPAAKALDKGLKILGKPVKDYAAEIKGAAKIAKLVDGKLASESTLRPLIESARDEYRTDLVAARAKLAELLAAPAAKKDKVRKLREKQAKKGDKALGKASAAPNLGVELKLLAKAAKSLQDHVPPRSGGGGGGGGGGGEFPTGFVVFTADHDHDGNRGLYLASGDGRARSLTESLATDAHVSRFELSPTGPAVAFIAGGELYVMTGADPLRVSEHADGEVAELEWSPDGARIGYRAGDPDQLFVVNADGSEGRRLTGPDGEVSGNLRWSPDGGRIAYRKDPGTTNHRLVFSIRPDGTGEVPLSATKAAEGTFRFHGFEWAPVGDRIVMREDPEESGVYDLWISRGDGSERRKLSTETETTGSVTFARHEWSSDGTAILFERHLESSGKEAVFVVETGGGDPKRVTPDSTEDVRTFAWSPDTAQFAFVMGQKSLHVSERDGTPRDVLTAGFIGSYEWSPGGERLAFETAGSVISETTLWVVDLPTPSGKSLGLEDSIENLRREAGIAPRAFGWGSARHGIMYVAETDTVRLVDTGDPVTEVDVFAPLTQTEAAMLGALRQATFARRTTESGALGDLHHVEIHQRGRSAGFRLPLGGGGDFEITTVPFKPFFSESSGDHRVVSTKKTLRFNLESGVPGGFTQFDQDWVFTIVGGEIVAVNCTPTNLGQTATGRIERPVILSGGNGEDLILDAGDFLLEENGTGGSWTGSFSGGDVAGTMNFNGPQGEQVWGYDTIRTF